MNVANRRIARGGFTYEIQCTALLFEGLPEIRCRALLFEGLPRPEIQYRALLFEGLKTSDSL
jgi:hypothetical protein